MTLQFGKFKGQQFENTPRWYQKWLLKQDWFKAPKQEKPLHQQLNGWDGHSRKGEAIYDSIFEQEKKQGDLILDNCAGSGTTGGRGRKSWEKLYYDGTRPWSLRNSL